MRNTSPTRGSRRVVYASNDEDGSPPGWVRVKLWLLDDALERVIDGIGRRDAGIVATAACACLGGAVGGVCVLMVARALGW
jgi:hypothetical protein